MALLYTALAALLLVLLLLHLRFPYFVHDVLFFLKGVRLAMRMRKFRSSTPCYTILDRFLDAVKNHPEKKFVVFEGRSYTYSEADRLSSKAARALLHHTELQQGDTVALFLGNEPNFIWVSLGLFKLGCTAALLNSNIRSRSLLHCFTCCGAKTLIAGAGLPKAAVINHERVWLASFLQSMSGICSDDVLYLYLPLYHSAGFLMGLSGAIERGITVVLRRKFSVSQFWNDCRKNNVTVIQYIGEIMRYLCNSPKTDSDRTHNVRLALGNGIRADTWTEFLQRFGDVRICECYGATEGNIGFVNYVGKIGAIGRENSIIKRLTRYALIKYNAETEELVQDSRGFCVEVSTGETGLLVAKISKASPFHGYANNKQQTDKKKLRNVFEQGDVYYNTGDLMKVDQEGFIYFQDRIGDTFRWKGENVATTELADILIMVDFIEEANVYGVKVPGQEGRIGMAAIKLKEGRGFDSSVAYRHVESYLPAYARPRFIRIQEMLDVTGTYKQVKVKMAEEGFNPKTIQDNLYFLDDMKKTYVPMTEDIFNSICNGQLRL
ncbi:hypothetical protein HF521_003478 [Silurus meridionalis]|uniref:long-chain-fatty-acid--CoA ligase n=1 Tax=Silurus meridionalis TaxID=175797 RepID=A0A8T0B1L9_SILME|nr:hypothetical protein HF521_003478 [Silurus meridionalis]